MTNDDFRRLLVTPRHVSQDGDGDTIGGGATQPSSGRCGLTINQLFYSNFLLYVCINFSVDNVLIS